jgi:glycerol-3-phosphate dehydrogenase
MALLIQKSGGKRETVFDLAGIGDLYVTSASGRNRRFGEFIGRGMNADEAYRRMLADDEVAEGYSALKLGMAFIERIEENFIYGLPLFDMLYRIVYLHHDVKDEISRFLRLYEKV